MAGIKNVKSGGSGGEVSPLAAQLQQAWLHTQMPKAKKRSASSSQLTNSLPVLQQQDQQQSALESLSSIFPELASTLPQKKKPRLFSFFQEGEALKPKEKKVCFKDYSLRSSSPSLFPHDTLQSVANRTYSVTPPSPLPHRPTLCASTPVVHNSDSVEHLAAKPVPASQVFSENCTPRSSPSNLVDLDGVEFFMTEGESSVYEAMVQELGDLIAGDDASQFDSETLEKDLYSDDWLNDILGGPVVADISDGLKDGSRSSFADDETGDPLLDLDLGNSGLLASQIEMTPPEAAAAEDLSWSTSQSTFNSESLTAISEDALHHSHIPDGGGNSRHFSKPTEFLWVTNGNPVLPDNLHHLLLRCAEVIEENDISQANKLIAELRQHSSAIGNPAQRTAHYFMEALVARMTGTGGQLYRALNPNHPSAPECLKAFLNYFDYCPIPKLSYFFCNMAIMQAFGDAKRVHIVDYGILYGMQWPSLIYHLSQLPGGPPHLRITGIDWTKPGFRPTETIQENSERIQETGRNLACVAQQLGVPFDFHAIAEKWEAITPAHLFLRSDEVLAVNCINKLHHLFDEYVVAASPRNLFLSRIKSMNPKIFVHGVVNGNYNAPFFMSRFRGAMDHYSTLFEIYDATLPHPERVIMEQEVQGRAILNIVACEGLERVERAEPYTSWHARSLRAGFTQIPIPESTKSKIRTLMTHFPRDFSIGEDNGWFLAGWKGKVCYALSACQPTSRMTSSKQPP
ncbi:hypothetical protein BDL97_08G049500 [Sphagnum fallax]|nr:hypothetical protein BDL97_08G049500 [Sphagnum fallax]